VSLENARIVILGGSSGIGFATARAALAAGARVTITGRSEARLAHAKAALPASVDTVALDATDEAGTRSLLESFGELDHVFVTAGEVASHPRLEPPSQEIESVMDTRFLPALFAAKHAAARIRPGGSIIFMSGTASLRPLEAAAAASASCGAVEAFARALAVDLAPVRVNAIRPGFVDTPFLDGVLGAARDEVVAAAAARLPVGRIGRPEDVADAVLFLMRNQFVTGVSLTVDGGGLLV